MTKRRSKTAAQSYPLTNGPLLDRFRAGSHPGAAQVAARLGSMNQPQASVDWLGLALGFVGTVGALIAVFQGSWPWAVIIFLASILAELLIALARRRRARRPLNP